MKTLPILLTTLLLTAFSFAVYSQDPCTNCEGGSVTGTNASGLGTSPTATGHSSLAGGHTTTASGNYSVAFGYQSKATGISSFAFGSMVEANHTYSTVIGRHLKTMSSGACIWGTGYDSRNYLINSEPYSLMVGFNSQYPTLFVSRSLSSTTTGKIGIGNITNPLSKLHLLADENEAAEIQLEHRSTGIRQYAQVMLGTHSIRAGNAENMVFTPAKGRNFAFVTGNVGINTTAPTQKLDIDGNIRLRNTATIGTWSNNSLTFNTNSSARMIILPNGKIGIGKLLPDTELDIAGDITVSGLANLKGDQIVTTDRNGKLMLITANASGDNLGNHIATSNLAMGEYSLRNDQRGYQFRDDRTRYNPGLVFDQNNSMVLETGKKAIFKAVAATNHGAGLWAANWGCGGYGLVLNADNSTGGIYYDNNNPQLSIGLNNSKVGIGVMPPSDGDFRLYVQGGIVSDEVKVMMKSGWSDFVFSSDYALPGINEVSAFIKSNGHLPGIPNAATVAAEGIELGQMNALLLMKIEELTLYVIELKNENENIQQQLNELKK